MKIILLLMIFLIEGLKRIFVITCKFFCPKLCLGKRDGFSRTFFHPFAPLASVLGTMSCRKQNDCSAKKTGVVTTFGDIFTRFTRKDGDHDATKACQS